MLRISLIICTHNPRLEYLNRVWESLKVQTLEFAQWELLLIDNGSKTQLSETIDLSWHPNARIVREDKLGLTPARICGIVNAKADILLFVDDDNCLKENYLELGLNQFQKNPLIGTLGAGKIIPEFEVQPTKEETPYTIMLALREETRSYYSSEVKFSKAIPYGAGMFILKSVALNYVESCAKRAISAGLDRTGGALLSGGDVDLALHACQSEYIAGVMPELELLHIIPKSRLDHEYLIKIAAGHAYSHYMLGRIWGYFKDYPENAILKKIRYLSKTKKISGLRKAIFMAEHEAIEQARTAWQKSSTV
ncbi:glycosyltransferase [Mucilaginibacter lacusdianchii]|uniref:glycosyltransferase n=1 Tax=Mucilaginibacter lacusdianchii TaxID=2684211 RepID=UPI00131E5EAB|nr:glycosyltransferase [Mucilaginibacter sp. JXJ CY 39]